MLTSNIVKLESQIVDLAKENFTGGLNYLSSLTKRSLESIDNAIEITEIESNGRKVVISLDLCEILDSSMPFSERRIFASESQYFNNRTEVSDLLFSRQAIEEITKHNRRFSILPGTGAEILLHLRHVYSESGEWRNKLANAGAPILSDDLNAWGKWAQNSKVSRSLLETIKFVQKNYAEYDKFLGFVQLLLDHDNFVSFDDINQPDDDIYNIFLDALGGARHKSTKRFANIADAINLSIAAQYNEAQESEVLTHMTRASSLHNLAKARNLGATSNSSSTSFEISLKIHQNIDGTEFSTLCHPHVISLLGILDPGSASSQHRHETALGFRRVYRDFADNFRLLIHAVRKEKGWGKISYRLGELQNLYENDETYQVEFLRSYIQLIIDNSILSDQILNESPSNLRHLDLDANEIEGLRESVEESNLLLFRERMSELYEAVRKTTGVDRLTHKLGPKIPLVKSDITLFEDNGFYIDVLEEDSRESIFMEYRVLTPDRRNLCFGIQLVVTNKIDRINLFWKTSCSYKKYTVQAGFLARSLEDIDKVGVFLVGDDSVPRMAFSSVDEFSHKSLPAEAFPLSILQFQVGNMMISQEYAIKDRDSYTSIELGNMPTGSVWDFVENTGFTPPISFAIELVENLYKEFG